MALISKAGPERDSRERFRRLGQHSACDFYPSAPEEFAQRATHGSAEGPGEAAGMDSDAPGDLGQAYAMGVFTPSQRDGFSQPVGPVHLFDAALGATPPGDDRHERSTQAVDGEVDVASSPPNLPVHATHQPCGALITQVASDYIGSPGPTPCRGARRTRIPC